MLTEVDPSEFDSEKSVNKRGSSQTHTEPFSQPSLTNGLIETVSGIVPALGLIGRCLKGTAPIQIALAAAKAAARQSEKALQNKMKKRMRQIASFLAGSLAIMLVIAFFLPLTCAGIAHNVITWFGSMLRKTDFGKRFVDLFSEMPSIFGLINALLPAEYRSFDDKVATYLNDTSKPAFVWQKDGEGTFVERGSDLSPNRGGTTAVTVPDADPETDQSPLVQP